MWFFDHFQSYMMAHRYIKDQKDEKKYIYRIKNMNEFQLEM